VAKRFRLQIRLEFVLAAMEAVRI